MAYVVSRRDARGVARYEIRESVATAAGPRSRSLATFRTLTDDVIAHASARARRKFDADKIRTRAAALGVPRQSQGAAAATASALLARLRQGDVIPPAIAAELRRTLPRSRAGVPDSLEPALAWIGVDDAARGRALRDLLDLASRIPPRARPPTLGFPRMSSGGDG